MKVLICKASLSDGNICPIKGAMRVGLHYYHYAVKGMPNSIFEENKMFIQKKCTDIETLDNGNIRGIRKDEIQRWMIDIDDIFQFVKEHGSVIIDKCDNIVGDWYRVTIYDDYVE